MNRDPFYDLISRKLSELEDDILFERCVCGLLCSDFPTLIPIEGGGDDGVDGAAISGAIRIKLISTIQNDVISNVTKSLKKQIAEGTATGHVLIATSQDLTGPRRKNIRKRVEKLGFTLAHEVYSRQALTNRLYRNPHWCKELLGIAGTASALGNIPKTIRPFRSLPLLGRDDDLKWLFAEKGDRLIVGQPGVGKSFLLQSFVNQGGGLFVINPEIDRLVDAIRERQPTAVVIEDAHVYSSLIGELLHFRNSTGMQFDLIADSWPGMEGKMLNDLSIPKDKSRTLKPLEPPQIVELTKAAGIVGPQNLLHEIVRQSVGLPGRASMLIYLCFSGGTSELWSGDALARLVTGTFENLVSKSSLQTLAAFALGGTEGVAVQQVAEFLQLSSADVHSEMVELAAGGLVEDLNNGILSVVPQPLRCALVKEYFFRDNVPFPLEPLIQNTVSLASTIDVLVGALMRGAKVDPTYVLRLLEQSDFFTSQTAWEKFAWSGESQARIILERHADMVEVLAVPLLHRAPSLTIPMLLKSAIGDSRPLDINPDHLLRKIEEWVVSAKPETGEAIPRRKILLETVCKWLNEGSDEYVGLRALQSALSPKFEDHDHAPGDLNTFVLRRGGISLNELRELAAMWPQALDVIGQASPSRWDILLSIVDEWLHSPFTYQSPPDGWCEFSVETGLIMARDLAALAKGRPGVLNQLKDKSRRAGGNLEIEVDEDYRVMYPEESFEEDWNERSKRYDKDAKALADRWARSDRDHVVGKLIWSMNEAAIAGDQYPNFAPTVCREIARSRESNLPWVDDLLENSASPELILPFLEQAAKSSEVGWQDRAIRCLKNEQLGELGFKLLLESSDVDASMLQMACENAGQYAKQIERMCRFGNVPDDRIAVLLSIDDPSIKRSAAIGLWCRDPRGQIPDSLSQPWRIAVITSVDQDHQLSMMIEGNPELACDWLKERASRQDIEYRYEVDKGIVAACQLLHEGQRKEILMALKDNSYAESIAECCVSNSTGIYMMLLADADRSFVHLAPLRGPIGETWGELAALALDAGYSQRDLLRTAYSKLEAYPGEFSEQYESRAREWTRLESAPHPGVRELGKLGREQSLLEASSHKEREQKEAFRRYYS